MPEDAKDLQAIYQNRFEQTAAYRGEVWEVLAPWLSRYFPERCESLLDLGCGYGEWINRVAAKHRHAMDLNADARRHLAPGVVFHEQDCTAAWPVAPGSLDAVVTSNFFEHLPNKDALRATLLQAHRALRPGGRLIAMGPNIRYLPGRYWDFIDHHIALTDASLGEALRLAGFKVTQAIPRFLPYSMVGGPRYPLLFLRLYLALRPAWPLFGRQFLLVAEKPAQAVR
jgi:SAM-dependent methyltransferase